MARERNYLWLAGAVLLAWWLWPKKFRYRGVAYAFGTSGRYVDPENPAESNEDIDVIVYAPDGSVVATLEGVETYLLADASDRKRAETVAHAEAQSYIDAGLTTGGALVEFYGLG